MKLQLPNIANLVEALSIFKDVKDRQKPVLAEFWASDPVIYCAANTSDEANENCIYVSMPYSWFTFQESKKLKELGWEITFHSSWKYNVVHV